MGKTGILSKKIAARHLPLAVRVSRYNYTLLQPQLSQTLTDTFIPVTVTATE